MLDDDGDSLIDLEDPDCADFPEPFDCVFLPCGCRYPFELYFASDWKFPSWVPDGVIDARDAPSFYIACTNSEPLAGLEFGLWSKEERDFALYELTSSLSDPAGEPVEVQLIDGQGNILSPQLPNTIRARKGSVSLIERGEALLPFATNDFLWVHMVSSAEGQSITVKYLVDETGGSAVLPPNTSRPECPGQQLFVVRIDELFHRGDADGDGQLNLTDAIVVLEYLFRGRDAIPCREAANANDDSSIDLSDAVYLLLYLFQGGLPPSDPGPVGGPCGPDPASSPTRLGCASYAGC